MNTEREKIKELMNMLNFPAFNDWGYELMELFHNAVRNEALESAAKECDERFTYYNRGACEGYESENCAAAIRVLKDDGYGADNPNTTDWRRPLLTKVEVL